MFTFSTIIQFTGGTFLQGHKTAPIAQFFFDSRKPFAPNQSLFLAINTRHGNGHRYISELYEKGVRNFMLEEDFPVEQYPQGNFLQVPSTLKALQKIAIGHRKNFGIPVIGITGSNGKTIVKEWLFQLLTDDFWIVKNSGSFNSQLGVPLSILKMDVHHQMGIFEAGISKGGEMAALEDVMQPTLGIFTNLGSAHDSGFPDRQSKLSEKCELFKKASCVIHCSDHLSIGKALHSYSVKTFTWGFEQNADVKIKKLDANQYDIQHGATSQIFSLPFTDHASVENILHCITLLIFLGYDLKQIQGKIKNLHTIPMRLALVEGIHQNYLIDDSYNNDLEGLKMGLDFLSYQNQSDHKRLILSEMLQNGLPAKEWLSRIQDLLKNSGVNSLIGIGETFFESPDTLSIPAQYFPTTEAFLKNFNFNELKNEVILIKGARPFHFEKIVSKLQKKAHGTVMEINLDALVHNLNVFKNLILPGTKIMAMVKASSYGSGSHEIANLLQYHHVDYLGVAYADEGVELRKKNISIPIMVMNPSPEVFDLLLSFHLEPEIYSLNLLQDLAQFLNGRKCGIHLKLDTGMHRLGLDESEIEPSLQILLEHKNIKILSVFSHLAGSDSKVLDDFTQTQSAQFLRSAAKIENVVGYRPILHLANTGGIIRHPSLHLDMVRLGIGLYGINPTQEEIPLIPIATLKTIISQIKIIKKGETVGYNRMGKLQQDTTIATIAIGYADGFSRAFSGGLGSVWVQGKRAPVVGNVCMDMTLIDVTGIDVHVGDEVIIFGPGIPLEELAKKLNTIPYELLTQISDRVKRTFLAQG